MARDRRGGHLNLDLMAPRHCQEMDSWLNSSCVAGSPVRRPTVYHPKPQRTCEPGLHWNPEIVAQLALAEEPFVGFALSATWFFQGSREFRGDRLPREVFRVRSLVFFPKRCPQRVVL
jgi:hypothetical protein